MSARSLRPLALTPAATPPARTPGTAVTPPSSHSKSAKLFDLGGSGRPPSPPTLRGPAKPCRSASADRHGYTGGASRPVRSFQPSITLRFWTPLADPPLPRLSIAETQTARLVRWSTTTVRSQKFEPTTPRV